MKRTRSRYIIFFLPVLINIKFQNILGVKKRLHICVEPFVPWVGIEPTLPKELDFESSASTSSATKAGQQN